MRMMQIWIKLFRFELGNSKRILMGEGIKEICVCDSGANDNMIIDVLFRSDEKPHQSHDRDFGRGGTTPPLKVTLRWSSRKYGFYEKNAHIL